MAFVLSYAIARVFGGEADSKPASKLEVVYFPIRGRAEAVRLLLADNGIEFTDTRIAGEAWNELKPKTHFGQVDLSLLLEP